MESMDNLAKRLDRFELQLDEIRAAFVQMAKTEERVSIMLENTTKLFDLQSELQKRVAKIESENATQGQSIGFFERAGWIVAGAIASIGTWLVTK